MLHHEPHFDVSFAQTSADLHAVQRLRYSVFVTELGAQVPPKHAQSSTESDRFDKIADHLILRDLSRVDDQVIGVYRLMNGAQAAEIGQFSCAEEYDVSPLVDSGQRLLELGRSCLHADYRGGTAMFHLWRALADHIAATQTDVLFGVASFHGVDTFQHAPALNMLFDAHPSPYKVTSRNPAAILPGPYDRKEALRHTPALIKAYLRLGGTVGQGAFIDHEFNTIDVCMILDVAGISARQKAIYAR